MIGLKKCRRCKLRIHKGPIYLIMGKHGAPIAVCPTCHEEAQERLYPQLDLFPSNSVVQKNQSPS